MVGPKFVGLDAASDFSGGKMSFSWNRPCAHASSTNKIKLRCMPFAGACGVPARSHVLSWLLAVIFVDWRCAQPTWLALFARRDYFAIFMIDPDGEPPPFALYPRRLLASSLAGDNCGRACASKSDAAALSPEADDPSSMVGDDSRGCPCQSETRGTRASTRGTAARDRGTRARHRGTPVFTGF